MFSAGWNGSVTPSSRAVAGINCISPMRALGRDRARVEAGFGLNHGPDQVGREPVAGGMLLDQVVVACVRRGCGGLVVVRIDRPGTA